MEHQLYRKIGVKNVLKKLGKQLLICHLSYITLSSMYFDFILLKQSLFIHETSYWYVTNDSFHLFHFLPRFYCFGLTPHLSKIKKNNYSLALYKAWKLHFWFLRLLLFYYIFPNSYAKSVLSISLLLNVNPFVNKL